MTANIASPHGNQPGTDVLVIGAGLSGLMAAVHAVQAGARVRLIAEGWGQQLIAPGWISVCDRADDDVIAEVRGYAALHPDHPYAKAGDDAMVHGLEAFQAITAAIGLSYDRRRRDGHNMRLITMLGAIQRVMMAPRGIANSDWTDVTESILLVGLRGWRDFYPELAAGNLRSQGIEARAIRIDLPEPPGPWDRWPTDLARLFDSSAFRAAIIKQVQPHIRGVEKVGFPAVLGLDHHTEALTNLSEQIERLVFEIPTLPPSLPGLRLSNRLRRWLLRRGVRVQIGHPVTRGLVEGDRCVGVEVQALGHVTPFYADHVILATGGLYSGGIQTSETGRVWEPIFDLPTAGPDVPGREGWYYDRLLKERGHPIHRQAGLRVDHDLRPLNAAGEPALANVYATGHMLAGFNPLTDGCAEGIALATAYKAVHTALELDDKNHRGATDTGL
ncbi:MAG: anaerobic glycerol-3-phosphate dehydrogenase subunit B [Anaerolineae bacterium]|nr:anaerobic glycerol-3-phosphate dehydrogenase subunit B [Anaerolineae bacterium]